LFSEFFSAYNGDKYDCCNEYLTYGGMPVMISRDEIRPWLNDNERLSEFLERPQVMLTCEQDAGQIRMDFGL